MTYVTPSVPSTAPDRRNPVHGGFVFGVKGLERIPSTSPSAGCATGSACSRRPRKNRLQCLRGRTGPRSRTNVQLRYRYAYDTSNVRAWGSSIVVSVASATDAARSALCARARLTMLARAAGSCAPSRKRISSLLDLRPTLHCVIRAARAEKRQELFRKLLGHLLRHVVPAVEAPPAHLARPRAPHAEDVAVQVL